MKREDVVINYFEKEETDNLLFNVKFIGMIGDVRIIVSNDMVKDYTRGGLCGKYLLARDYEGDEFPEEGIATIFIDDWAYEHKKDVMEFIIYHEYGHIVLKHPDRVDKEFCGGLFYSMARSCGDERITAMELEADAYAAEHIGVSKAISGLEALTTHLKDEFPDYESKEIEIRLQSLKRMC